MNPSTELLLVEMRRLFAEQSARLDRLFDKYTVPAPSTVAGVTPAPTAAASVAPAASTAASVMPAAAPSAAASATTASSTTPSIASLTPVPPATASVVSAPAPPTAASVVPAAVPSATAPSTTITSVIASLTHAPPATASVVPAPSAVDEPFHAAALPPPVLLESEAEELHWFVEAFTSDPVPSSKQNPLSMLLQQSTPLQAKHKAEFIHHEYQQQIRKLRVFVPASSLLQMVVPVKEEELPSTLPDRCLKKCLPIIQRCFSFPFSCSWDAVRCWQYRPWPPPSELQLVNCEAELRPLPWPSFDMVARFAVTSLSGRLWKPPWYVSTQQHLSHVLPEPVDLWTCLMRPGRIVVVPVLLGICLLDSEVMTTSILSKLQLVHHESCSASGVSSVHILVHNSLAYQPWRSNQIVICWISGTTKIYLAMSEYMARVGTVCSPCYVDVAAFGESDDEKPEKLEALVAAVHSGGNSPIFHIAAGVLSDINIIFSSSISVEGRGSDSAVVAGQASSLEFRVPQNNSLLQRKCGGSSQLDLFVVLIWAGSTRMHISLLELSQTWLLPALVEFIDYGSSKACCCWSEKPPWLLPGRHNIGWPTIVTWLIRYVDREDQLLVFLQQKHVDWLTACTVQEFQWQSLLVDTFMMWPLYGTVALSQHQWVVVPDLLRNPFAFVPSPANITVKVRQQRCCHQFWQTPWSLSHQANCAANILLDMEQIIYSWSLFFAHCEWCLAICPKFFKVSSNRCTICNCSAMYLELPLLLCWNSGPIRLLGGMTNVAVVPLPQTFMCLPQKHDDGFFTISNEQTELPVTYHMHSGRLWNPPWHVPVKQEINRLQTTDFGRSWQYKASVSALPSLLVGLLQSFSDQITFHIGLCNELDLSDTSLSFHWDPGGAKLFHRLGGKPKLKKGGMSVYTLGLLTDAAHMKLVTHIVADTNLNSDMLVTTKLTNVMLSSKAHHFPWDPGGSELVLCIVQWRCVVRRSKLKGRSTSVEADLPIKEASVDFEQRLGGKPLFKKGGMSGCWWAVQPREAMGRAGSE